MKVLKFGGTSVGTTASLRNVKAIVDGLDSPAVVVVSALGGLTDNLIETAHKASGADPSFRDEMEAIRQRHFNIIEDVVPASSKADVLTKVTALLDELSDIYTGLSLIKDLPAKTLNQVVSFGERMSSIIVAAMIENGVHLDSLEVVKTEKWFNKDIANRQVTDANIRSSITLPLQRTVVAGGFISRDINTGEITNLGRGGSDYTAALIAASLNADSLEIWTDVDGFMTADPRIIPDAKVIPHMSFIESMELCSFGAKVIYPPTIYPVFHKNIPIKILNTHNPSAPGTLITDSTGTDKGSIRGISPMKKISVITLEGDLASNVAEINTRTYNAMARNGISMFLVSQPDRESTFSFSLTTADADKALEILNSEFAPELQGGEIRNISLVKDMSIIAVVGEKIKDLVGLEARITYILKRNDIEVFAVSNGASETTITIVVSEEMVNKALQLVHGACF